MTTLADKIAPYGAAVEEAVTRRKRFDNRKLGAFPDKSGRADR